MSICRLSNILQQITNYSETVHSPHHTNLLTTVFRGLIDFVGDVELQTLNTSVLENFILHKLKTTSHATARTYYNNLSAIFGHCVRWELIHTNPIRRVIKPRVPYKPPISIPPDEFKHLLKYTPDGRQPVLKDLFIFGYLTGARCGEIINLRWKHINLSDRTVYIEHQTDFKLKSNESVRIIPVCDTVVKILCNRHKAYDTHTRKRRTLPTHTSYVFTYIDEACDGTQKPYKRASVTRAFKRCVRRAELDDRYHFHLLRNSFATNLIATGATLYQVQKLLGHRDVRTTEKYVRLDTSTLHTVVDQINLKF